MKPDLENIFENVALISGKLSNIFGSCNIFLGLLIFRLVKNVINESTGGGGLNLFSQIIGKNKFL